jgi:hypothetical protein
MQKQEAWSPVRAAIDIGSNTLHVVVARASASADMLDIVADKVDMVRIGESVTASGQISPEKSEKAIAVLSEYKKLAEQHGAQEIFVVATEAIRQADNADDFIAQVKQQTGLQIQTISGDAEATLTFLGATYEAQAQPGAPDVVGVADLGGGSMELVTARQSRITWKVSVPIGSGWMHDRFLDGDPPAQQQIEVAETFLNTFFSGMRVRKMPPVLIATGGSANSLLHLAHRAFHLEEHQTRLTRHDLLRCQGLLSALPSEEVTRRFDQPEGRARIMLAGALILEELMARLRLDEIQVSPHGIREGVLLAYARYGSSWLKRVSTSAASSRSKQLDPASFERLIPTAPGASNGTSPPQVETYSQAGQRMLRERLEAFLDWPGEVLKNEDVEAVHKMRVASRRLRATLDAFEPCCEPRAFKRVYRRVKKTADSLGKARDTDVMIQSMQEQLEHTSSEEQPGVSWLIERLQEYRQDTQGDLVGALRKLDGKKLEELVEACIPEERVQHG